MSWTDDVGGLPDSARTAPDTVDFSHWNWRVARFRDGEGHEWYHVIEVFYDGDGRVEGWGPPGAPVGDDVADLRLEVEHMMEAFDRPIFEVPDEEGA